MSENAKSQDNTVEDVSKSLEKLDVQENKNSKESAASEELTQKTLLEALRKKKSEKTGSHKFWSTQPVPQEPPLPNRESGEKVAQKTGEIDVVKTTDDIRTEPYNLPKGFVWDVVDVDSDEVLDEVYTLLYENYVEDDDNMFRFAYSKEFLRWALRPPGYKTDWIVGVRQESTKKLLGLITGIPAKVHVKNDVKEMAEINFLCVHKILRTKRLAPVLIKEVTRRVNLTGRWQAVYTAGVVIPTPISKCRYHHRSLNPAKLIAIGFSGLAPRMTLKRTIKLYKLPEEPTIPGMRPMEEKDIPQVTKMLKKYLNKFDLWIEWDAQEAAHWLLTRDGVVNSYVVAQNDGKVTDFCSFYLIPSSVIGNDKYDSMVAAYSYYNVATSMALKDLMYNALIMASKIGCDVMNCLDLMDNKDFIEELKFGNGDGYLNYYLFNFKCPFVDPSKLGIVLL